MSVSIPDTRLCCHSIRRASSQACQYFSARLSMTRWCLWRVMLHYFRRFLVSSTRFSFPLSRTCVTLANIRSDPFPASVLPLSRKPLSILKSRWQDECLGMLSVFNGTSLLCPSLSQLQDSRGQLWWASTSLVLSLNPTLSSTIREEWALRTQIILLSSAFSFSLAVIPWFMHFHIGLY